MLYEKCCGTAATALWQRGSGEISSVRPLFFKPYKSAGDVLFRTVSIVTDPLLLAVGSASFALEAAVELVKGFVNLIVNSAEAKFNFYDSGESLKAAAIFFVAVIASALVNFVDLIGGGIASLKNSPEGEEVDQHQPVAQCN